MFGKIALLIFACALALRAAPAMAADKIAVGIVGGLNAFVWPAAIAQAKGFYARHGVAPDIIFIPSSPGMLQQLAASSLDIAASAGLVNPVRLVARGAPIALGRIELRVSPYALIAKPEIHAIADLKGKNVAIGSRSDITWILILKMLAPSGIAPSDVEMMFSGSTVSRYAALKSGAFDATFLAPPLSFIAQSEGFRLLGIAGDFAKDLPFTGSIVNRGWVAAHLEAAKNFFAAEDQATDWFHDDAHRDEAIKILVEASKSNPEDAARSYDFLRGGDYFDRSHKVSRRGVAALVAALHALGDTDVNPTPEQMVVPGLTELAD
ncbi:MAG TPA: ABC transporter substrate-binding protein [Stellaceae bacterium]|jgi:ABC-type nitrate/sulfonate/bicarbonate transport system substrate-binding protein|nr:ABC transporter substrate-binding protein [Stellaceae bacterium]